MIYHRNNNWNLLDYNFFQRIRYNVGPNDLIWISLIVYVIPFPYSMFFHGLTFLVCFFLGLLFIGIFFLCIWPLLSLFNGCLKKIVWDVCILTLLVAFWMDVIVAERFILLEIKIHSSETVAPRYNQGRSNKQKKWIN